MTTASRRLAALFGPILIGAALGFDASHQDGFDRFILGLVVGLGVGMVATAFVRHDNGR